APFLDLPTLYRQRPDGRGSQGLMRRVAIGVDLGGTIVRAGAISADGRLLAVGEIPIEAARGPEPGLRSIQGLIEQVRAESETESLIGIGIGSTGPVDPVRGTIHNPYTLPTWEAVPITGWMQKAFDVPVTLENDADAAALGEYWYGAGRSVKRLFAVTVGTGVGTALIQDGQIYRGLNGLHPEAGHMLLDPAGPPCYCGAHGCWESFCAGPSIVRDVLEMDLSHSILLQMAGGAPEIIDARMVTEAARLGDPAARQAMDKAARYFGLGIVNVIIAFLPEMIVLSGGLMKSSDLFLPAAQQAIQTHSVMIPAGQVRILPAQLGYHAGLYGAAYSIWSKENGQSEK
ncbi:MAG TPA: ROK family protein, partial [Anaerolineales bacterium]